MADAPLYHRGDTFTFTAPCRATGYAKFDIPTDEPVKIIITGTGPEGAGLGTAYLKASGGAVDGQMKGDIEVAGGPIVFDVTGQCRSVVSQRRDPARTRRRRGRAARL